MQRARTLLAGDTFVDVPGRRRDRPKGSTNNSQAARASVPKKGAKLAMSLEGKATNAGAQKARWAIQKKAAANAAKETSKLTKAAIKIASPQKPSPAKKKAPASPPVRQPNRPRSEQVQSFRVNGRASR